TNIMVGYRQTNQKTDTGKTLTRWPVFVDHFSFKWPVNIKVMPGCFAKAPVISGHKLISKP
ncbi:hypothetical protein AB8S18_16465, partial [Klebsiella pneumoniae subsp. ozaenae]